MKEQGRRQDDPELIQVCDLLTAIHQQSHFVKQRDGHAQQLNQRPLLQQSQASSVVNGAHSHPGTRAIPGTIVVVIRLMYRRTSIKGTSNRN